MDVGLLREYASLGFTRQQIAEKIGMSYSKTSKVLQRNGILVQRKKTKQPLRGPKKRTLDIVELRKSGMAQKDIASIVGCSVDHVQSVCRDYKLTKEQKLTESQVADYVSRSGFDYVSGYAGTKKNITVRCRTCGRIFDRQAHIFIETAKGTLGHKNECPLCRADRQTVEREQRNLLRKAEREHDARTKAEQRAMREADLISRQMEERLAIHVCKNCGTNYSIGITGYNSKQYCSKKCMKRWVMRIKNDRRIKKMKARQHDTDITLEKLFNRDAGVCYLCGNLCDWRDMADGNAGDKYPSIDHVIPLSKGGTHTWDNVKLACRRCNWEKSDTV